MGETKRIRLEFNAVNVFNQKTARYQQNIVTRYRDSSSAMDMHNVNLLEGLRLESIAFANDLCSRQDSVFGSQFVGSN